MEYVDEFFRSLRGIARRFGGIARQVGRAVMGRSRRPFHYRRCASSAISRESRAVCSLMAPTSSKPSMNCWTSRIRKTVSPRFGNEKSIFSSTVP
jgi:hypothetical protein